MLLIKKDDFGHMPTRRVKAKELKGLETSVNRSGGLNTRGYTVPELIRVTGMSRRQVRHWAKIKFLRPCLRDTKARGSQHASYYSAESVIRALIICEMTRRGLSLAKVRRVEAYLKRKGLRLNESAKYLITDGETAYYAESETRVVDILKHENQMILIPVWEKMAKLRQKLKLRKVA
jgi:DNA-binding transcriptional MerR regulator